MSGSCSTAAARFGLPFDLERWASGGEELGRERRCGGAKLRWWGGGLAWRTSGGVEELRRDGRSAGRRSSGDTVLILFWGPDVYLGDIFRGLGSMGSGSMLVISSNDMSKHRERFGRERGAAGSTSPGDFPSLPIRLGVFGKAQRAATLFGSFDRLFSPEPQEAQTNTPYSSLLSEYVYNTHGPAH
jgi:hypothetical protein